MFIRHRYIRSIAAGVSSWNSASDLRGVINQIAINPSSSSTTYDFKMTDDSNTVVYHKEGLKGDYTDESKIGVYGTYTLGIENASVSNKSFTVTIITGDDY